MPWREVHNFSAEVWRREPPARLISTPHLLFREEALQLFVG